MSEQKLRVVLSIGLTIVCCGSVRADTFYNGWNYAIDAKTDGSPSGGGTYEEYGLAFRQDGQMGFFAISGNVPLAGVSSGGARNGSVALGDLFLNFSSHNLDTPGEFQDADVFAIRFASNNDSLGNTNGSNTTTGVFENVTAASYTTANAGYSTLQSYWNAGYGAASRAMGDLSTTSQVQAYVGNGTMYPNISAGTKIGDITMFDQSSLQGLGLDFAHFNAVGSYIFGFSVDLSLLPAGQFTAHFFEECLNDGIALQGSISPPVPTTGSAVPEPTSLALAGFAGLGMACGAWRRRKKAQSAQQAA